LCIGSATCVKKQQMQIYTVFVERQLCSSNNLVTHAYLQRCTFIGYGSPLYLSKFSEERSMLLYRFSLFIGLMILFISVIGISAKSHFGAPLIVNVRLVLE